MLDKNRTKHSAKLFGFFMTLHKVWCASRELNVVCPNFVKLHSAKLCSDFNNFLNLFLEGGCVKPILSTCAAVKKTQIVPRKNKIKC